MVVACLQTLQSTSLLLSPPTHLLPGQPSPVHITSKEAACDMAPINLLPPKRPRVRYVEAAAALHPDPDPRQGQEQEQPFIHAFPSVPLSNPNPDITSEPSATHPVPTEPVPTLSTVTTLNATAQESCSTSVSETSQKQVSGLDAASDMARRRNRRKEPDSDDEHVLLFKPRGSSGNNTANGNASKPAPSTRAHGGAANRNLRQSSRNAKTTEPNASGADWPAHPTPRKFVAANTNEPWQPAPVATTWQVNDSAAPSKNSWASKPGPFAWNGPAPNNDTWTAAPQTANRETQTTNRGRTARTQEQSKNQCRPNASPKGQRRPPRESPWIKDSDIPKGKPKRHEFRWTSPTRTSTMNSNRASSGWGTRKKRAVDGDGAPLADWSGGFIPATIDWDSRSQFRDYQSAAKIEAWLDSAVAQLKDVKPICFPDGTDSFSFTTTDSGTRELHEGMRGDVVPRYWIPTQMDDYPLDLFWAGHIRADKPKPVDEGDLEGAKPWWKTYQDKECSMLRPLKHPEITRVDPDENEAERLARENDNGGDNAAENRVATEKAKRLANRKRTLAKRDKAHKFSGAYGNGAKPQASDPIKPDPKTFLRCAAKEDMVALRDIYNRYIDNAIIVPETIRRTEGDMLDICHKAKDAKLPFIVACQRGEKIKSRGKKYNAEDVVMSDRVIGFAYASDLYDKYSIFNSTVQMHAFVHMEHYMQNIGDCLIDKMMGLLDPKFVERGGYTATGAEIECSDSYRGVANILVHYSYEAAKTDKLIWVSGWLRKRFGLEKVADLQWVAQKFDKQYVSFFDLLHSLQKADIILGSISPFSRRKLAPPPRRKMRKSPPEILLDRSH